MQRVQITTLQRGQVSVYCQDVSVNQRLVISRVDARQLPVARSVDGGIHITRQGPRAPALSASPKWRWSVVEVLLLFVLAWPLGVGAQTTTCTTTSVAVTGTTSTVDPLFQENLVADCNTLLGLKDTLRGTATLNWAEDLAMTSWDGVTLWLAGRVLRLNLNNRDLDGTIPAALGDLASLNTLTLHRNALTGPIPAELGNLSRLNTLTLNHNQLSGPVPAALGKLNCLQHLPLDDNQLTGLPASWEQSEERAGPGCTLGSNPDMVSFADLRTLTISNNKLSGTIPAALGDLSELTTLHLTNNELSGTIPAALGDLSKLIALDLSDNKLSGTIPAALGDLSKLTTLRLNNNALTGNIPEALGRLSDPTNSTSPVNLAALDTLDLSDNQLSGPIPAALGRLTSLLYVDLCRNKLTAIPAELRT